MGPLVVIGRRVAAASRAGCLPAERVPHALPWLGEPRGAREGSGGRRDVFSEKVPRRFREGSEWGCVCEESRWCEQRLFTGLAVNRRDVCEERR